MQKDKPTTVDAYIDAAPQETQKKLREMRALLKEIAPNALEKLKWGTPVFEENRILFSYAAFTSHLTFTPTRSTINHFKEQLTDYKTGHDSIQFPYNKPLPKTLIRKIATYRVKEVAGGALWKHKE